mmetsp:Transcript_77727/g.240846  ORF Transcript_77727/g.240846 Transcript_77727/m.240846 type:complete len:724 (-) Transcript_77727:201-2372(-)|eukprot:CAMPEP_0204608204 /NCGR_PEP_ID=MMETSP0661-20131031/60175_1 /ASSEMBLY_ACC=CAM_ASM_000606 /TAXON_ID=109239 /ORGANISM="Alexandrium margalefi, Strain AMGDE01CS-322" /LENGTH=723 /DNA_ID=CAMNT_0051619695 /DNA_START=47 /DNA_END=2218 /DNA_ORIENTATION=+
MSGGLFNVFQAVQFTPQELSVPEELQGQTLRLKPSDGEALTLDAEAACASERLKQLACANGAAVELQVPVKKAILSKLIEYMTFHKDTPPSEVRTPLVSDNIADVGLSKWDTSFIKVDKETLFELMYAAGTFEIPSLTFLCCVQAALMMKGKSADKLRKDYGLSNDLPGDEEERLSATYGDISSRKRFPPEEGALDAFAAVLHGVHAAAEKNGGLVHGGTETPTPPSIDLKSWRANSWRAMVMEDWQQLFNVPDDIRDDRELLFTAVDQSKGVALHLASDTLKGDKPLVLRAVHHSGDVFEAASDSLKGDREFVLEAMLAGDGTALKGASESLRGDRKLILTAASKGKGGALKGANEALQSDMSFVLDVVTRDAAAYKYASEELLYSKDFAVAAAKRNGLVVQYMSGAFRADHDVAAAALANNPKAAPLLHAARRSDLKGVDMFTGAPEADRFETKKNWPMHMGVPLTADAAREGLTYVTCQAQKYIMFTALSTITPNMGQANYIAANAFMDKMPGYSRPETDTIGIMWGTVGGMGMRFKAFGSQDFMNMTPDNLLSINDCCKILHVVTTLMDPPEWFAANFFDEGTRNAMLAPTAGMIRGEAAAVPPKSISLKSMAPAPPKERKDRPAKKEETPDGPLGGWPQVARAALAEEGGAPLLREPGQGLSVGAAVVLTGIKNAMNGATGKLLQIYPEGKCRVALSNGKGNALLRPENLQVVMAGPA